MEWPGLYPTIDDDERTRGRAALEAFTRAQRRQLQDELTRSVAPWRLDIVFPELEVNERLRVCAAYRVLGEELDIVVGPFGWAEEVRLAFAPVAPRVLAWDLLGERAERLLYDPARREEAAAIKAAVLEAKRKRRLVVDVPEPLDEDAVIRLSAYVAFARDLSMLEGWRLSPWRFSGSGRAEMDLVPSKQRGLPEVVRVVWKDRD